MRVGEPAAPGPPAARDRLNLIEQISADALASDYVGAAPERGGAPRRQRILVTAAALAVLGFVIAMGISARIINAPVVNDQSEALRDRIEVANTRHEQLTDEVTRLREELEAARDDELQASGVGQQVADSISDLELVTGYTAVTGPGAVVSLADSPTVEQGATDDASLGRVLDADVQRAVNGLWQAGAEAVAVNGQRLTARSAIRSAAGAILVNYRPLTPPYLVEAVGPRDLADRFAQTRDAADLSGISEQFGIGFATRAARDLRLPAGTSPLPESAAVVAPGEEATP